MRTGAVILCGGNSTRMGRDKAMLPFGLETMLERVVRLVAEVVAPANIVVVTAAVQSLPQLPPEVKIAHDEHRERGPLEGLAAGLHALRDNADAVYATGCDVPLLVPAFVERMFALLDDHEVAVPRDGEFHHPLAAVYRPSVLATVERLLATDRLSPRELFGEVRTLEVPVDRLRGVDPQLLTLRNLNRFEDYLAAHEACGLAHLQERGQTDRT